MIEIVAGIAVVGWIAALYCFLKLREARREVESWKRIAEDSRRESTGWRNEALRVMDPGRRDRGWESRGVEGGAPPPGS